MCLREFFRTYPRLLTMNQAQNKFTEVTKKKYNIFKCALGKIFRSYPRLLKLCQAKFNKFKIQPTKIILVFQMCLGIRIRGVTQGCNNCARCN